MHILELIRDSDFSQKQAVVCTSSTYPVHEFVDASVGLRVDSRDLVFGNECVSKLQLLLLVRSLAPWRGLGMKQTYQGKIVIGPFIIGRPPFVVW